MSTATLAPMTSTQVALERILSQTCGIPAVEPDLGSEELVQANTDRKRHTE